MFALSSIITESSCTEGGGRGEGGGGQINFQVSDN